MNMIKLLAIGSTILSLGIYAGINLSQAKSDVLSNAFFERNKFVIAHKGATGVVKMRMDHMKAIGADMRRISSMVRGKTRFDGLEIAAASKRIAVNGLKFNKLFPEGTSGEPSQASEKIWKDWQGFNRAMNTMVKSTAYLAKVASGGNTNEVKVGYRGLGKTCSGCHRNYRVKRKSRR